MSAVLPAALNDAGLRMLLAADADLDPLYPHKQFGELFTNHLPMALQALWRLGASQRQLEDFRARYVYELVPVAQREPVDVAGSAWRRWLGDWRIYLPLRVRLRDDIAASGRDAVLREWLPRFIDIPAIDAFHPLIRTAYAIEQGIDEEIAAGLAYWAACYVHAAPIAARPVDGDITNLFARLRLTPGLQDIPFNHAGFNHRLFQICALPAFAQVSGWRPPSVDLRAMAREAARIYLSTHNFFALHMVTGTQAMRMLLPHIDDHTNALDRCWQALAGAYLIISSPEYREPERGPGTTDGETLLAAVLRASDDAEHVTKLAHSAAVEFDCWRLPEHALILEGIVRRWSA